MNFTMVRWTIVLYWWICNNPVSQPERFSTFKIWLMPKLCTATTQFYIVVSICWKVESVCSNWKDLKTCCLLVSSMYFHFYLLLHLVYRRFSSIQMQISKYQKTRDNMNIVVFFPPWSQKSRDLLLLFSVKRSF